MIKTVFITGANSGLGKDSARQFALQTGVEKVYLGCRNEAKALAAKAELEQVTGKQIFEIVLIDVSNLDSVHQALTQLPASIDALVMNAGGIGGKEPNAITPYGVNYLFSVNVLGHVVLLEELLKADRINEVAIYAGSEAARGVKKMKIKRPVLKSGSVKEFQSIMDGSFYTKFDGMEAYGYTKLIAALWMSSLAREYPKVRLVTVSPGGTSGTAAMNDLPPFMRFMFKTLGTTIMPLMGMMHKLEVGAKRYVDVVMDPNFKSGLFYASKEPVTTGPLVDQTPIYNVFANREAQDNARQAIHRYLERVPAT